jgi:hypothetical protein
MIRSAKPEMANHTQDKRSRLLSMEKLTTLEAGVGTSASVFLYYKEILNTIKTVIIDNYDQIHSI